MQVDEFLTSTDSTTWIIEGLLPHTHRCLLVGWAGSGKSWLMEDLALSVASGADFLGHYPVVTPGPVLLVDQDTPTQVLRERLIALSKRVEGLEIPDLPQRLYVSSHEGIALDKRAGADTLTEMVREREPVLVILETLNTITSGDFNENHANEVRRLFEHIEQVQQAHPCTILISHHFGKAKQTRDPMGWIRDSRVFLVQPFPKRVKMALGFQVELRTTEQDGVLESAHLVWLQDWDTDLDLELAQKRTMVLELAGDRGSEGLTVAEVQTAAGGYISDREARTLMSLLLSEGALVRGKEAHGRFRFWVPASVPGGSQEGEVEAAEGKEAAEGVEAGEGKDISDIENGNADGQPPMQ